MRVGWEQVLLADLLVDAWVDVPRGRVYQTRGFGFGGGDCVSLAPGSLASTRGERDVRCFGNRVGDFAVGVHQCGDYAGAAAVLVLWGALEEQ